MIGKKKIGRPPRHWADKARTHVWYFALSRLTGLSDYALDKKFVTNAMGEVADEANVFRKIRTNALLPGRGSAKKVAENLIVKVDSDPELSGLKAVYDWKFWDYLQNMPNSLTQANVQLEGALVKLGIKRVRIEDADEYLGNLTLSLENCYLQCLSIALSSIEEFTRLWLLALLLREADLARNSAITELLRRQFDTAADVFFNSYLPVDLAQIYYLEAVQQVCFTGGLLLPHETSLRSIFEKQCARPLIRS